MRTKYLLGAAFLAAIFQSGASFADETKVSLLTIRFDIAGDDKEHQDAVAVEVTDGANQKVFDREIVPATGNNGDGDDQNKYYWPKDGGGYHYHEFNLPLSHPIPVMTFGASTIKITSYTYGGHGDFESWIARVHVTAYLTSGDQKDISLNGVGDQTVNWQNNGSPGPYVFHVGLPDAPVVTPPAPPPAPAPSQGNDNSDKHPGPPGPRR